ncbi:transketolase-like TK C-terminal-containing protein [Escherichia coli]
MDRTARAIGRYRQGWLCAEGLCRHPGAILIATGSEVELAVAAYEQLTAKGRAVRVVSLPATDVFDAQVAEYKESVLPSSVTQARGHRSGHRRLLVQVRGLWRQIIGMTTFGESAPAELLFKEFGFTVENVVAKAKELL